MKTRLTHAFLDTLKPRAKDQLIWDADLTGFYVKLTPVGHFVFMVYFRVKGRQCRRRIGAWPEMTPEAAREAAREVLSQARQTGTPPERKQPIARKPLPVLLGTFWESVVLPDIETRLSVSTVRGYRRAYVKYIEPVLGACSLDSIQTTDIATFRSALKVVPATENRVMTVLRCLFQKGVEERMIAADPLGAWRVRRHRMVRAEKKALTERASECQEKSGAKETPETREETGIPVEEWDVESSDTAAVGAGRLGAAEEFASGESSFSSDPSGFSSERAETGDDKEAERFSSHFDENSDSASGVLGGCSIPGRGRQLPRRVSPERLIPGPERDAAFVERIARIGLRPDSRVLSYYDPRGHICEEYRLLGKNLFHALASMPDADMQSGKVVVLSSSVQGEGKTLTCVNLALTLAQDLCDRVVLWTVTCAIPRFIVIWACRYRRAESAVGRRGTGSAPRRLFDSYGRGLHLLLSAASEWNPAQLLDGTGMTRLLGALRKRYSLILVDSPPILTATDALSLGAKSDGMLFLLRARRTQREQIQEARQRIARLEIRMLGYVINNVRSFLPQIWRKYYYGNY
jgi:Mrp family chromosome partitioning ATPase